MKIQRQGYKLSIIFFCFVFIFFELFFIFVAKYVATAILISSFLGSFEKKWAVYLGGSIIVAVGFSLGLYFIKEKKEIK